MKNFLIVVVLLLESDGRIMGIGINVSRLGFPCWHLLSLGRFLASLLEGTKLYGTAVRGAIQYWAASWSLSTSRTTRRSIGNHELQLLPAKYSVNMSCWLD
jgi:hypothetical protein